MSRLFPFFFRTQKDKKPMFSMSLHEVRRPGSRTTSPRQPWWSGSETARSTCPRLNLLNVYRTWAGYQYNPYKWPKINWVTGVKYSPILNQGSLLRLHLVGAHLLVLDAICTQEVQREQTLPVGRKGNPCLDHPSKTSHFVWSTGLPGYMIYHVICCMSCISQIINHLLLIQDHTWFKLKSCGKNKNKRVKGKWPYSWCFLYGIPFDAHDLTFLWIMIQPDIENMRPENSASCILLSFVFFVGGWLLSSLEKSWPVNPCTDFSETRCFCWRRRSFSISRCKSVGLPDQIWGTSNSEYPW